MPRASAKRMGTRTLQDTLEPPPARIDGVRVWYPNPMNDAVLASLRALVPGHEVSRESHPDAEMLIEGRATREQIEACPNLRFVVIPFAGVSKAMVELASDFPRLTLHNLHHNAPETSELALALLFAAAKQIVPIDQAMRKHDWSPRYAPESALLLEGKTCVLLGYGEVGRRIGQAVRAIGMETLVIRRNPVGSHEYGTGELREVLPRADVLMVTTPLTDETQGLIGQDELAAMPHGAILVNVARAQIVDEEALYLALKSGKLHSAGLDVWYRYPREDNSAVPGYFSQPASAFNTPPSDYPYHELPNLVMSPHRGGATAGTEDRRVRHLGQIIEAAAAGEPVPNRVNLDLGY
jgi:phosphoglycerate dehydrogenase-like enzyme